MKFDLIIFPMHDWKKGEKESFRTRDGHLLQEFGKSDRVGTILVVDRPGSLPEMIARRRSWRVKRVLSSRKLSFFSQLSQVAEATFVLDIFSPQLVQPLWLKRDWWHYIFALPSTWRNIEAGLSELNMVSPVLFLWNPMSTPVIGRFGERLVVFDAIDNWLRHPEIKDRRGFIREGYEIIKKKADLIIVNSQPMKGFMSNPRTTPFLLFNGVDKDYFSGAQSLPLADIQQIPRPIVGYAGKLSKRLDRELLSFLSTRLPQVSFVFIGQMINQKWVAPLFRLPNFYYLGDKLYKQLPAYLAHFDVGIIPHKIDQFIIEGDSLKMYEYLAAGKPVVTTKIAGVDKLRAALCITDSAEEFLNGIAHYLELIKSGRLSPDQMRNSLPPSCSWKDRADLILSQIAEKLK